MLGALHKQKSKSSSIPIQTRHYGFTSGLKKSYLRHSLKKRKLQRKPVLPGKDGGRKKEREGGKVKRFFL